MIRTTSTALLLVFFWMSPAQPAELRLTVNGIRSDSGEVLVGLYDNAKGFIAAIAHASKSGLAADSGRLVGASILAKSGSQSTVFTQLPPGRYAAIVVHDEDDDGRLNTNGMGVPAEGYGFSNDARGFLSAPSFDAAAIVVGDDDLSTAVHLIYPSGSSEEERSDYERYIGSVPETDR